jgi:hypothetical protein
MSVQKCRRQALRDQPDRWRFMATVVGLNRGKVTIATDLYSVIEVVDGQRRITTPILLLKVQRALGGDPRRHTKLVGELQAVLIKQDELSLILLQMNHDPNGYFANYLRTGIALAPEVAATLAI